MKIEHMALYVADLEAERHFFEKYFGATANQKYRNPKTGLETYFLTFDGEARLEIMSRPGLHDNPKEIMQHGFIHLALRVGSRESVDHLSRMLQDDGYVVVSGPRTTGDGYYESCILDPEQNQIEIVA